MRLQGPHGHAIGDDVSSVALPVGLSPLVVGPEDEELLVAEPSLKGVGVESPVADGVGVELARLKAPAAAPASRVSSSRSWGPNASATERSARAKG